MTRLLAMSVDLAVVVLAILVAGSLPQLVSLLLPRWPGVTEALRIAVGAVVSIVPAAYFFVSVAVTGRTLGKSMMGVRIVARDGRPLSTPRSLLRTLAYLVSLLPLGAGFLAILVDRERRGWHDRIAGSLVVHDGGPPGV